jgi:uroporphyrinogen decarboxylase
MPVEQIGVDAAIIFADILLITEPMGMKLDFHEGKGPSLAPALDSAGDVERLRKVDVGESLAYVFEGIRMTRQALPADVPLIGFCGAPFTVAGYMVEGSTSRNFQKTKALMYNDPDTWRGLMERITQASANYLNGQIDAGVTAIQIFDSWAGCLCDSDYHRCVLPHTERLIHSIKPGIPVIHFAVNNALLLKSMCQAGGDVIGLDWRVNLAEAWSAIGYEFAVQGNLDPIVLLAGKSEITRRAEAILEQAAGRPGHIFNLGHGLLPDTPVDNVRLLVDVVHDYRY